MKTIYLLKFITVVTFLNIYSSIFSSNRCSVTVLNIDAHGIEYTPEQLGNLVRLELEKLDTFEVMDRYDVAYLVKKNNLDISNCFGKIGLVESGTALNSEKMLSGSVDVYGEALIITFRVIDVKRSVIEKTYVREFLNYPKEIQAMIRVSLRELFGLKNDEILVGQLSKPEAYETVQTNPDENRLNLSGPRMGITTFTGEFRQILVSKPENGGFDMIPYMYQFGFQFEKMYLNQGNFQALFEFIPMITGLDQSVLRPSLTILNGIRHNLWGYEFAVGPNISVATKAEVFQDNEGKWQLKKNWNQETDPEAKFVMRADSRGESKLSSSFVIAMGKTFRSGRMNFPVNVYCIPARDGLQFGLSLGYNAKNRERNRPNEL
jgi:hypothetical protein